MTKVDLQYVELVRAKGRDYYYYRRGGRRQRIPGELGGAEFLDAYRRIHDAFEASQNEAGAGAGATAPPGSVAALVEAYKKSPEFNQMKDKTRADYRRYLDRIAVDLVDRRGVSVPVARLERKHVIAYRDRFADKPRTANFVIQILRLLLGWGLDRGWLKTNPAARPRQLKTGDGHRPWTDAEIAAFRQRWPLGTVERTAFEIALGTGQRGGDIIAMRRADIEAGVIAVSQEKTGARVWIPISQALRAALDAWDAAQAERQAALEEAGRPVPEAMRTMLLTSETGKAFRVDRFRHVMVAAYQATPGLASGLEGGGVTTHGLRYTAATILHELGVGWDQIAAITGHETVTMVRKYTAKRRQAKAAIARLDEATAAADSAKLPNRR